jgi:uncharacterized protein YecE (DUF72 family)
MENLRLGTIGWSYNFWKGNFYPHKTLSKDYLVYYASQFNTVEVDNTFYRIPAKQTIIKWKEQTPNGFVFSLKFPLIITHVKMLKDCQNETVIFLDRAKLLGEKLGPLLLQFPPNFTTKRLLDLEAFLQVLPRFCRYAIEIRDKTWLNQDFYSLLRTNKVTLAWADSLLMAQVNEVTGDFLYVRWEGDRKKVKGNLGKIEVDKKNDVEAWANKLKSFNDRHIEIFGYFGKYFSGYPPYDLNLIKGYLH